MVREPLAGKRPDNPAASHPVATKGIRVRAHDTDNKTNRPVGRTTARRKPTRRKAEGRTKPRTAPSTAPRATPPKTQRTTHRTAAHATGRATAHANPRTTPRATPACIKGRPLTEQPLENLRSNAQRQWGDRAPVRRTDASSAYGPLSTVASLTPDKPARYLFAGIVIAVIVVSLLTSSTAESYYIAMAGSHPTADADTATVGLFPDEVEYWRPTVAAACKDLDLGPEWQDTALAIMQVESGGDRTVSSVVGCSEDIMQAGEGCAGVNAGSKSVSLLGANGLAGWDATPSIAVPANCATASIYAGVIEIKETIGYLESWLGPIDPDDTGKIGLIAQGYNYGCAGWSAYCEQNGITTWTYEASAAYQYLHAGGTVTHGQKVMDAYDAARGEDE